MRRLWPADADPTLTSPAGFAYGQNPDQNTQNAVMQALMNIPMFINWARSHESSDLCGNDCTKCALKEMAHDYWTTTTPALPQTTFASGSVNNRYFPADHPGTTHLLRMARIANVPIPNPNPAATARPRRGALKSAYHFYDWVTDRNQIAEPLSNDMDESMRLDHGSRNHELDALFQLAIEEKFICRGCAASPPPGWGRVPPNRRAGVNKVVSDQPFIELPSDGDVQESLETALGRYLRSHERLARCPDCDRIQNCLVHRRIVAAPQILRIAMHGTSDDPFDIPNKLCLTYMQKNCSLPLNYTLSSVIAHAVDDDVDTLGVGCSTFRSSESESDAGHLYRRSEDSEESGDYGATYFDDDDAGDDDITDMMRQHPELWADSGMDGIEGWEMRSATSGGSEGTIPEDDEFEFDEGVEEYFDGGENGGELLETLMEEESDEEESEEENSSGPSEDEAVAPPGSQWAINVRSRKDDFHVRDAHVRVLARPHAPAQKLSDNPQRPPWGDPCSIMLDDTGYRVSILTFTRDKLTGADRKREMLADENRP